MEKSLPASKPGLGRVNWHRLLTLRLTAKTIVAAGLLIRIGYLVMLVHHPLASDARSYNAMGLLLKKGTAFIPFWPPGIPLYLSLAHGVGGGSDLVARLAMLVFYLGTSIFAYRTAVLLTGSSFTGNLSLLALALSPATISSSVETMTELPTAMLLMVICYSLLSLEKTLSEPYTRKKAIPWTVIVVLGLSAGYLCLMRPSSLVVLVLLPVYLLWRRVEPSAALTVLFLGALVVATWIAYVHATTGRFVKINTANSKNLYLGNNPDTPMYRTWWLGSHHEWEIARQKAHPSSLDPLAQDAEFTRLAREYIVEHPAIFLLRTFNRICVFFAFDTYTGAYLIETYGFPKLPGYLVLAADAGFYLVISTGAILYILTLGWERFAAQVHLDNIDSDRVSTLHTLADRQTFPVAILMSVALLYAFPYFFAFSHPKYHYPIEPILMVFSAAFVFAWSTQKEATRKTMQRRRLVIAFVLLVFACIQVEYLVICERARLAGGPSTVQQRPVSSSITGKCSFSVGQKDRTAWLHPASITS